MPKNWQEAHEWLARGGDTPLVVSCPRCGRQGSVTPDTDGEYGIEWRDDANHWTWRDAAVTPAELESPEFGCGHDRRSSEGFVGSAPFVVGAAPAGKGRR
jgi:hypothetical protein